MSDNVDLIIGFCIPSHLVDAFDDFVTASVAALDGMGDRSEWAQDEREIVEWMEGNKWKPTTCSPFPVGQEKTMTTDTTAAAHRNTVEQLVGHIRHCRDVARTAWLISRSNTIGQRRIEIEKAFDDLFMAITDTERVAEDVPNMNIGDPRWAGEILRWLNESGYTLTENARGEN